MNTHAHIHALEILLIEIYNDGELNESKLREVLSPLTSSFIDPDQILEEKTEDGKTFREIICEIMMPQKYARHKEHAKEWMNSPTEQKMFDEIWFNEFRMPYCSNAAEDRMGIIL